jgi:membrane peptidoglycan carboxypeptidase
MALGAFEVTPLDLAWACVPFASGGVRPAAMHAVRAMDRADGTRVLPDQDNPAANVMSQRLREWFLP